LEEWEKKEGRPKEAALLRVPGGRGKKRGGCQKKKMEGMRQG